MNQKINQDDSVENNNTFLMIKCHYIISFLEDHIHNEEDMEEISNNNNNNNKWIYNGPTLLLKGSKSTFIRMKHVDEIKLNNIISINKNIRTIISKLIINENIFLCIAKMYKK